MRFLVATPEAQRWYDPMKPHALAEFDWVRKNIPLTGQTIIDAGAHHGLYTCFFGLASGGASRLISIDAVSSNCALVEANAALNGVTTEIMNLAVSDKRGSVSFRDESNGHIVADGTAGATHVESKLLTDICEAPTVVKLDVEGAEFYILRTQLDALKTVKNWIIEVHPSQNRHPPELMELLKSTGKKLLWVDRKKGKVVNYPRNPDWSLHTTVFAVEQ